MCGGWACAQTPDQPPAAQELLDAVVARLPQEPLRMTGDLVVRKRHGIVVRQLGFELFVDWGRTPALARYTLRDAFGTDLEQLRVTRPAGGASVFDYACGQPLKPAPVPDLFAPLQESDLSWMDLALSFLWWKGAVLVGSEEVLGRPCYVLEVPAPRLSRPVAAAPASQPYARVRLWIDKELPILLQAEGMNADSQAIRRLWVRSFKKIDDRWMIKDLEVQQVPSPHRTKLTIEDVQLDAKP